MMNSWCRLCAAWPRPSPGSGARDRILNDFEIRALWKASDYSLAGSYGTLVRVLLLTAQRRQEVAGMRHSEIEGDIWTIPCERAKNNRPNIVPLESTAMALLAAMTEYGDYVFGLAGRVPLSGFSKGNAALDQQMKLALAEKWKPWVVHDLRRTAGSLMSRAGVRPEIGERVLNHVISGVRRRNLHAHRRPLTSIKVRAFLSPFGPLPFTPGPFPCIP